MPPQARSGVPNAVLLAAGLAGGALCWGALHGVRLSPLQLAVAALAPVGVALLGGWMRARDARRQRQAEQALIDAARAAEDAMVERTRELAAVNLRLELKLAELEDVQVRLKMTDRLASLGSMAAGIAHELNNPLAFVKANLGFLTGELGSASEGDPELLAAAQEALQGTARMAGIVRDLQMLSRFDEPLDASVDLARVVDAAVNIARGQAKHRAVIRCDHQPMPPVRGNEGKLGQVVLNLLVNAIQALPERPMEQNLIVARTGISAEGRGLIEVADNGTGIPPEVVGRIFDPFFTTKPPGEGTGLGLAICQGIVTSMGGLIEVDTTPGRGTRFRVLLPLVPQDAAPASGQAGAPRGERAS